MTLSWSYVQYLEMCSRVVRYALKDEFRAAAIKRGEVGLKKARWEGGKQGEYRVIVYKASRMTETTSSNLQLSYCGTLKGHKGWVTSIAAPSDPTKNFIVSGSRDKTAIVWHLNRSSDSFGYAKRSLRGHNHFVQDVTLSADGKFAITASWDKTMRLWDLETGKTECRFVGHTGDVMAVSFSPDNRLIVSGSRDKTIKIWNTRGELKGDFASSHPSSRGAPSNLAGHTDWISDVRFSPDASHPLVVSAGSDRLVKVWELKNTQAHLNVNHIGHTGFISTVAISPDGTLCASAGKDCTVMLWDLNNPKHLYSLEAGDSINALIFSPNRYWLCAATSSSIKIWDLLSKTIVDDLRPEFTTGRKPECISLAWSADGTTLFCGYTDNDIRVWQVTQRAFATG